MNVSVEERLHDYGPRLDGAIAAYVDRSHDRVVPASLVEPAASERHAGARRRSTALAAGTIAIAIVVGTTILATRRTPAHPPSQSSATTTTTIGLHTINGKTFGPMPRGGLGEGTAAEWARIPDYIPVATRESLGIAGYIKKSDLFPLYDGRHVPGGPIMPVYADGGSPLVGHFYQCKGFVALAENPARVPNRCPPPTVIPAR